MSSANQHQLNQLILDYLVHQAYPEAARAFNTIISPQSSSPDAPPIASTSALNGHSYGNGNGNGRSTTKRNVDDMESSVLLSPPPQQHRASSTDRDGDEVMAGSIDQLPSRVVGTNEEDEEADTTLGHTDEGDLDARAGAGTLGILTPRVLKETRLRRDVQEHILSGRIEQAIEVINRHFPAVLAGSPSSTAAAPVTSSISPAPSGLRSFFVPSSTSLPPTAESVILPLLSTSSTAAPASSASTKSAHPLLPTPSSILRPTIISINLQLQSFVELIRNASTAVGSTPSSPDAATHGGTDSPSPPQHLNGNNNVDPMSVSTSSIASARTTSLAQAIVDAQIIYAHIQLMEIPAEREIYNKELQHVAGLMAYPDLWSSPVAHYLDQSRRQGLAELCNAAILLSSDRTATPLLALAVRHTTAVFTALVEAKVGQPGSDPKDKNRKMIPPFDLSVFLREPDNESTMKNGTANGASN